MTLAPPSSALRASVAAAGAALRAGHTTSRALVDDALAAAHGAVDLAAFVRVHDDRAPQDADRADRLLAAGHDLGPLHGVPVVLKDNVAEAGLPNRAASLVISDAPAPTDSPVVSRLRAAGAVVVGRTNMHELAWGGTTDNPHHGTCRNPWDLSRVPAGSSGGTAAAIAAGVCAIGIGTDTGGSVRLPSSVTNLTGLRPTLGTVPTLGVVPLAWTLDTVGPMARSAADCRAVFDSIVGPHADDPTTDTHRPADHRTSGRLGHLVDRDRPWDGLRVGLIDDHALTGLQAGVRSAFEDLLATVHAAGAEIRPVTLCDLDAMVDALVVVDACEPSAVHAAAVRQAPHLIGEDVLALLRAGAALSAVDYLQAQRYRSHLRSQLGAVWRDVDVLLSPTLAFTAPHIGQRQIDLGDSDTADVLVANMRFTALPSLTGTPALSLPCGFDGLGLPVGAQLVGPERSDLALLALGEALQTITDHHLRTPGGH